MGKDCGKCVACLKNRELGIVTLNPEFLVMFRHHLVREYLIRQRISVAVLDELGEGVPVSGICHPCGVQIKRAARQHRLGQSHELQAIHNAIALEAQDGQAAAAADGQAAAAADGQAAAAADGQAAANEPEAYTATAYTATADESEMDTMSSGNGEDGDGDGSSHDEGVLQQHDMDVADSSTNDSTESEVRSDGAPLRCRLPASRMAAPPQQRQQQQQLSPPLQATAGDQLDAHTLDLMSTLAAQIRNMMSVLPEDQQRLLVANLFRGQQRGPEWGNAAGPGAVDEDAGGSGGATGAVGTAGLQPRVVGRDERLALVVQFSEWYNQKLREEGKSSLALAFEAGQLAEQLEEGRVVLARGLCQAGKTGIHLICLLHAWLRRLPAAIIMCDTRANAEGLQTSSVSRLGGMLERLNSFLGSCGNASVAAELNGGDGEGAIRLLDFTKPLRTCHTWIEPGSTSSARILSGAAVPVTFYSCDRVRLVRAALEGGPPAVVILDEADKMFSSLPINLLPAEVKAALADLPRQKRQVHTLRRVGWLREDAHLIQREVAFHELAGRVNDGKFENIANLVQVTATAVDNIVWNTVQELNWVSVCLDKHTLEQQGYLDLGKVAPHRDERGEEVFLEVHEVKLRNDYGLRCADAPAAKKRKKNGDGNSGGGGGSSSGEGVGGGGSSSSEATETVVVATQEAAGCDSKIIKFYDSIERLRLQGQRGLLALDITNPRVTTENNTTERAKALARRYRDWIILVHSGLQRLKWVHFNGEKLLSAQIHDRDTDVVIQDIANGIASFDDKLDKPVLVIGYFTIKRSVSTRSNERVPTHIVVAPSRGVSLADLVQMVGRVNGKNLDVLRKHGLSQVEVLAFQEDWRLVKEYYDLVDKLALRVNEAVAQGRRYTLSEFLDGQPLPPRFKDYVRDCWRNMGQRHMLASKILAKVRFQAPDPSDVEPLAAAADDDDDDEENGGSEYRESDFNARPVLDAVDDANLGDVHERLLLALLLAKENFRMDALDTGDLRAIDEDLPAAVKRLQELRFIRSEHRGQFTLIERGRKYIHDKVVGAVSGSGKQAEQQFEERVRAYLRGRGAGGSGAGGGAGDEDDGGGLRV